ncbi:RAMP superfamily CRISPR-associated protein [Leucothrix pacifica]|uniref:CRISPR type III-associated protein domain-containing protein n=1 Tax=Leucothrix pacifica TaxID=1247513 RepID=A0A317C1A0_9GAMM|nr:RAMP superfamily CRISPR-associated protein [Leucothrix pacifica]PWQ92328.1 hypothetical protein DKW60_21810 [Leucothrix pacifica]
MIKQSNLSIDIRSYWHAGTGRGSGSHLDALVERDIAGLPFVSGKMIKGLLRDAVTRAADWGVLEYTQEDGLPNTEVLEHYLFGSPGFEEDGLPRDKTRAGILKFSDARMPKELITWLEGNSPDHQKLRDCLFRSVYSTAIEAGTGVAKKGSLRAQQVTVPMTLEANISLIESKAESCPFPTLLDEWQSVLAQALPLVRAVGSNRTRGLGRSVLSLSDVEVTA